MALYVVASKSNLYFLRDHQVCHSWLDQESRPTRLGVGASRSLVKNLWIPAFAGMTK